MKLFGEYLLKGFNYKDRNIRIKFLGDRAALDAKLQKLMNELEEDSAAKTGMTLNIAVNYGGPPGSWPSRWQRAPSSPRTSPKR